MPPPTADEALLALPAFPVAFAVLAAGIPQRHGERRLVFDRLLVAPDSGGEGGRDVGKGGGEGDGVTPVGAVGEVEDEYLLELFKARRLVYMLRHVCVGDTWVFFV